MCLGYWIPSGHCGLDAVSRMGTRKVILVADDEIKIRTFVREILRDEGYDVLVAADGDEALTLSQAHEGSIDLMVTDVNMPRLDGVAAFQRISAERSEMKVLFMSGGMLRPHLSESWPLLGKPFRLYDLLAKVHEILRDERQADSEIKPIILVVDQDEERKQRTKAVLTENGYVVLTADSVEEAEAISESAARIELMGSEVMLAGGNGVRLAERESFSRNIDTLLISHVHENQLKKVPGFSSQPQFLSNPFTPEELLKRVRQMVKDPR